MTMTNKRIWMLKVLGPYVFALGCYEVVLLPMLGRVSVFLEPRYAMASLSIWAHWLVPYFGVLAGSSGAWHLFLGGAFLAGRPLLKTYLVSEFVLCLPNFVSCLTLLLFGGGHVLTGGYIALLCFLLWAESMVPMALALGCLVERRSPG